MKLSALAVLLALASVACGGEEPTATLPDGSSSSTGPSITTSTSTTGATTSTSLSASTTTSVLEGTWADLPLVVSDGWGGMALGWWDGEMWVQVDESTVLPVTGGESYQVALLGSDGVVEGGAPTDRGCDMVLPDGWPAVELSETRAVSSVIDDGSGGERFIAGVAITAPWNITPRPSAQGQPQPDLENAAIELLEARGFSTESVTLVQVVDTDLDGDGSLDTLVVAESTELGNQVSGVYSLLFAISPAWSDPAVVEESVIPADEEGFPASFRVSAVADLSGDGVMEVVVDGLAWENTWVSVYELSDEGFAHRITAGCGV